MSSEQEQTEGSSRSTDTTQPVHGGGNSASVDQVFSMFKDYLEKKLEVKTKQIEQKSKIDKEVVQLKYKGNKKQYELNAELDSIIESIKTESERGEPNLPLIKKYSQEARELIRKRQKLIKSWQVVAEYESNELASDSEDEKRLKKARETASRKRRQKDQLTSGSGKKARAAVGSDNQLFRGKKNCLQFTLWFHMVLDPLTHPTILLVWFIYYGNLRVK